MRLSSVIIAVLAQAALSTAVSVLFPRQGCTPETAIASAKVGSGAQCSSCQYCRQNGPTCSVCECTPLRPRTEQQSLAPHVVLRLWRMHVSFCSLLVDGSGTRDRYELQRNY
ncbi:hypothetical protein B0J12DRAFT_703840 [Macrophomina phaseolina]|uniref:Uncharacterized protein n=1 Tax=Macrophomina phaseolina TaxID=35725 RepID=A0ABQ8FX84_9PEZI|nr:hypothetical protein B0J12DRAFT_703840 [Macrophomina phaseolina]